MLQGLFLLIAKKANSTNNDPPFKVLIPSPELFFDSYLENKAMAWDAFRKPNPFVPMCNRPMNSNSIPCCGGPILMITRENPLKSISYVRIGRKEGINL